MNSLPMEIRALQLQLDKYVQRIRQQAYLCDVTDELVKKFQNLLETEKDNLEKYLTNKKEAGANLEQARIEKEAADLAVQQILISSTDALPFSIVPNGGSTQLGGNPLGNNPSGSALGPAFRVDADSRGVQTPQRVGNISNYLSTIYGLNIDPTNLLTERSAPTSQSSSQNPFGFEFGTLLPGSSSIISTVANTPMMK